MIRAVLLCAAALGAVCLKSAPVAADTLVAARPIRSQAIITQADLAWIDEDVPGALSDLDDALGLEAKVNLYVGRPIRSGDLGPPAIIERNQIITLNYHSAGLSIVTEGRALGRAGPGDRIRVMNIASRATLMGTVLVDGSVNVAPAAP